MLKKKRPLGLDPNKELLNQLTPLHGPPSFLEKAEQGLSVRTQDNPCPVGGISY